MEEYLASDEAPTHIVVFEFSGAVLTQLQAQGVRAMSVDLRDAEHDGPHFKGDFREVIDKRVWEAAYFVGPNCYQHLQGDIHCLQSKIADCRAYWGAAFVLWCICYRGARSVIVEQPNTIGHKYFPLEDMEGVEIREFSTTQYGDDKHKFVRLTLVNAAMAEPTLPRNEAAVREPRVPHTQYVDAEARDRARSTFLPYVHTCKAIAAAVTVERQQGPYVRGYDEHVQSFGKRWLKAQMPLPPDWDNPTGAPLDSDSKSYQTVRGLGDGRRPRAPAYQLPSLQPHRPHDDKGQGPAVQSRRAERGDSIMASDPSLITLKLIDRELANGRTLKPELERRYSTLEHNTEHDALLFDSQKGGKGDSTGMLNWAVHPFHDPAIKGGAFEHVEQYLQFVKAVFAGSNDAAEAIRREESAPGCLMRGRAVRNLDHNEWTQLALHVAERAVFLKYSQHAGIRQELMNTYDHKLVYAGGGDEQVWGIGASLASVRALPKPQGANWLGKTLMRARLRLKLGQEPAMPQQVRQALAEGGYLRGRQPATMKGRRAIVEKRTRLESREEGPPIGSPNIWPPLRQLDATLRPDEQILDCGGSGRCGNNSLALTLARAEIAHVSGRQVREKVVLHAKELIDKHHIFSRGGGNEGVITTQYLLARSLASWPTNKGREAECTALEWIDKMGRPDTWVDAAFLAIAADCFQVIIKYYAVRENGVLSHEGFIEPSDATTPIATLKVALVIEQHYSAIVPCQDAAKPIGTQDGTVQHPEAPREYRQAMGLLDEVLIPSASQLLMAVEESIEDAERRSVMAGNEQEAHDLLHAMQADEQMTPSTTMLEAMRASREEAARRQEEADLRQATKESVQTARDVCERPGRRERSVAHDDKAATTREDADLQRALAESLREKEAQEERPLEECRGMDDSHSRRDDEEDGGGAPNEGDLLLDSDDELSPSFFEMEADDLYLSESDEPMQPGAAPDGVEDTETRQHGVAFDGTATAVEQQRDSPSLKRTVTFEGTGAKEAMARVNEEDLSPRCLTVVPLSVEKGQVAILVPSEPQMTFGITGGHDTSAVEAAEIAVETGLHAAGHAPTMGFTVGTDERGAKVVGVATRLSRSVAIARNVRQRAAAVAKGATAVWCLLAALTAGSAQHSRASVAVAAASHFITHDAATTSILRVEPTARRGAGIRAGKTDYLAPTRPVMDEGGATTPRELIEWSQTALGELKSRLLDAGDSYYVQWVDSARPLKVSELSNELLDKRLHFHDERLGKELFAPMLPVYETPWLPRMPAQVWNPEPGCEAFKAASALDLLTQGARERLRVWFLEAKRDADCLERKGSECDRQERPPTIMIGQDQVVECARGHVFDCRDPHAGCQPLDNDASMSTDFNLVDLAKRLQGYPDQRLASNVLEGIRLEADIELASVLSPQLVSAGVGYDSVQKTVRELEKRDFYDFFSQLPFWPIVVVGQGSRIKKVGTKKYRRTSDFSGPHKRVTDAVGNVAVPINVASRTYTIPKWIAHSPRPEIRRWAVDKYAHVPPADRTGEQPSARHKFPKEHKPSLADALRDVAILSHAAVHMGQPVFAFLEDAANYFPQFGYAPEELWKSNVILNARDGDLTDHGLPIQAGELVFISEKRLGFGSFASSNIAQRFSNAVTGWTLEAFDKLEAQARRDYPDDEWEKWIHKRAQLEGACRRERPKKRGEAMADCTQTRLASMHMYQDDPIFIVVGVDRTMRMLAAWREVTESINIEMARDKRQIGGDIEWIGISLLVAIGLVAIPVNKLLRARDAIQRTLRHEATFGEYRALVGLLEHLRCVARLEADATNTLYKPHGRNGESKDGPSTIVHPTAMMRETLDEWLEVIMTCAGAVVTVVFTESAESRLQRAETIVAASSDAAGDGKGQPGMGGFAHGFYWRVHLPIEVLQIMHITAWETLAACVNVLVVARIAGRDATLALQVDALLTPYVISKQKSKSEDVQAILHKLLANRKYSEDIAAHHESTDRPWGCWMKC